MNRSLFDDSLQSSPNSSVPISLRKSISQPTVATRNKMRYVKAERYRNAAKSTVNLPKISDSGSNHSSNLSGRSPTASDLKFFILRGTSIASRSEIDSQPPLFSESAVDLVDPPAPVPMDPTEEDLTEVSHIWSNAIPLERISHGLLIELKRDLKITPKLKLDTLVTYGVSCLPTRDGLVFPRFSQQQSERQPIPTATGMKTVRAVSGSITRGREITVREEIYPRVRFGGIFGYHLITANQTEVILTPTEIDAMAVYQETGIPTLALPKGAMELPADIMAFLEQFDKLILWFASDVNSWQRAKRFALKIGADRSYVIRPTKNPGAPGLLLADGGDIPDVLSRAEPLTHQTVETFGNLRETVLDDIQHNDRLTGLKWSRFPKLSQVLKGFRPGELTILTGTTGVGKTTFLSEYAIDLCEQGVNTLWGSFELTNKRLAKLMLQQFARVEINKADAATTQFDYFADKFERLPMYYMTFHGASSVGHIIEAISQAIYAHDIQHVVIDNLQFMSGSSFASLSDQNQQDNFVERFHRLAVNKNVHVTLVVHSKKDVNAEELSGLLGGLKAPQEADNILMIQQTFTRDYPYQRKYLQVVKNRFDGELLLGEQGTLSFDRKSLCFSIGKKPSNANKLHS